MFIAALFIIAKNWKQPKGSTDEWISTAEWISTDEWISKDEWIKKMWYVYNGILLSHKKE